MKHTSTGELYEAENSDLHLFSWIVGHIRTQTVWQGWL